MDFIAYIMAKSTGFYGCAPYCLVLVNRIWFLIPNMVDMNITKLKAKMGISTNGVPLAA